MKRQGDPSWAVAEHGNQSAGGSARPAKTGCIVPLPIPDHVRNVAARCRDMPKRRMMMPGNAATVILLASTISASAFCEPPLAPPPTSAEAARLYTEEFRMEFEAYFRDAQEWFRCIELQKQEVSREVEETAGRYQRFMRDQQMWEN